jgi:hypothetical protein
VQLLVNMLNFMLYLKKCFMKYDSIWCGIKVVLMLWGSLLLFSSRFVWNWNRRKCIIYEYDDVMGYGHLSYDIL